ncbi:MAG: ABC transporter substrate-binding protein [Burkholderiales bacterium]
MKNRRHILIALGAGTLALVAPPGAFAQQQGKVWRVGFLAVRPEPDLQRAFARGMSDLGYVEGRNLVIDSRSAEGKVERLPALADDLVRTKVDVIVTGGTVATAAAQRATGTIPIVMGGSADPIGNGLIKSLAHPGGNITGLSTLRTDASPKLLELLRSVVPGLSRVAVLVNPTNTSHGLVETGIRSAAQGTGLTIVPVQARSVPELEKAFSAIARDKVGALVVMRDGVFLEQRRQIAEFAMKNRLPTISDNREYVDAGVLMSYGPSLADQFRRTAAYVDKIFKGARPGDLPVEQPTTLEFIVNQRTAKAVGLAIPQSVLLRADEVIQ